MGRIALSVLSLSNETIVNIGFLIYEIGVAANNVSSILISFNSFSHGSRLSSTHFLVSSSKYRVDIDVQV